MDALSLKLVPHISEQTYALAQAGNVYVFKVPIATNKQEIKAAVEKQFKVTVETVNIVVLKGKSKKSYRKGQQPIDGARANSKKAYIKVKSGDKIPVYEEIN